MCPTTLILEMDAGRLRLFSDFDAGGFLTETDGPIGLRRQESSHGRLFAQRVGEDRRSIHISSGSGAKRGLADSVERGASLCVSGRRPRFSLSIFYEEQRIRMSFGAPTTQCVVIIFL